MKYIRHGQYAGGPYGDEWWELTRDGGQRQIARPATDRAAEMKASLEAHFAQWTDPEKDGREWVGQRPANPVEPWRLAPVRGQPPREGSAFGVLLRYGNLDT